MLAYLAGAGHDKYIVAIRKYLTRVKKRVLSPYAEMISFAGVVVLLTRSLNKH